MNLQHTHPRGRRLLKPLLFLVGLAVANTSLAQVNPTGTNMREALKLGLYPPDVIMRHQQTLGLSAEQRREMAQAVKQFQSDVAELQWALQSEQQALKQMLGAHPINADTASAQADRVLALENQFKSAHFRLLISIKNALAKEQIAMIDDEIRKRRAENRK